MYSIAHISENWLKITRNFLFFPGLCPAPFSFDLQSAYFRAAGTKYQPVRLWLYLRYGLFDLQSADFFRFFIRNLRLALGFSSGFFNEEYLIALVDFIAPCGGTKEWGRRDLRIPPSPPSGLPPFQPWGIAAAGYWAAAGLGQFRNPVSGASRLSPLRREDWVLCVRAWTVRVSVDFAGHWFVRFSLVVGWTVRSCGYVGVLLFLS